ncbi:bifunctional alpha,alpha-trehalose-phosphate synthase (UDP-forming)/trehalose-phosphatase [Cryobacterium sp. TMT1-21]|uniref:Bifunctional alpha,alpha-trehalose-phosphate synthase (UDP-forming)/trehalose-phosphatase n=1 Tax=Cryobacterium shii TaxID=1259235 RepID=A0AAQ2C3W0_9MICO|nr:bifunctional alpha,alpha-trehalose-phosphate synthase (UDP-forming)/trehalose-phosphatase [Cryobacterium shii]TFC88737.1 bifunctional alpha,alpha-trehalose-phosphate synthase (UDP-forming)/trehalose-phosphatase [Cryobacterium sp. TmT2-59]TFD12317.1 bifunctional alpha,alpha-trehalose-phosphate synthase (UDP-forming)/trehalose-phosphatase [Cryobacterium sp. TMT1-21]TFD16764.1 bifunctional alpha,alpha-trehalose-phosphate synthase (UDP-forming)/trehalose-phosphatase [Cryobacterium sp. TMT4-10]TF
MSSSAEPTASADGHDVTYSLVVVSNRLPVEIDVADDGTESWRTSPGGLVTALEPLMRSSDGAWVGWPGVADRTFEPFENDGISIVPVRLSEADLEDYYEGFSNDTIWPLYHDVIAPPSFHREWWDAYVRVNRRFAEAAAAAASTGATVWVHDYQLQLVPRMLREARPDLVIGFFNHIPFPPYGIYAQLPWRKQILDGLLGADLVGFQRLADAGNFSRAVRRLYGYPTRGVAIDVPAPDGQTRRVIAKHFPISIDAASYEELARDPEVQARARQIREDLGNPKTIMLGVDRLDYTKGIAHRIKAFGELLADGSLSVEDVTLVQVASPSRERVGPYIALRDEIELAVGRLNGDFSTISHTAISYHHHGYPREEMVALYLAADVMLVTALRDGMNLVAKEYVAVRFDRDGVLVLSEFAGAADELKQAVLINPHDIDGVKAAILRAIAMPRPERQRRMRALRRKVFDNDVAAWSSSFLRTLTEGAAVRPGIPDALVGALREVSGADKLLVALDFDGTLAPHVDRPEDARAVDGTRGAVQRLLDLDGVRVAFVSGRALVSLRYVSDPQDDVLLTGSHGIEVQLDTADIQLDLVAAELEQLETLNRVLEGISASVEGTWIERKPAGRALHTRLATPQAGQAAQKEARDQLSVLIPGMTVRAGKDVLEFAVRGSTKGDALERLREYTGADRVFYAGDDLTDEDAFAVLHEGDLGLKIGAGPSLAGYRVRGPEEVPRVLGIIADIREAAATAAEARAN